VLVFVLALDVSRMGVPVSYTAMCTNTCTCAVSEVLLLHLCHLHVPMVSYITPTTVSYAHPLLHRFLTFAGAPDPPAVVAQTHQPFPSGAEPLSTIKALSGAAPASYPLEPPPGPTTNYYGGEGLRRGAAAEARRRGRDGRGGVGGGHACTSRSEAVG
jgi:hypothetical protein